MYVKVTLILRSCLQFLKITDQLILEKLYSLKATMINMLYMIYMICMLRILVPTFTAISF